ncbi:transforming acidic coiled-coil-containing protein 1 isoform X2 [Callorhinchus milii]|uniref:transforming acidic coiled-coil-containing protein 1 isoform X2 n=1 Tax=Callorhinchus milii TaxID=7868 RepID=UPI001C3FAAE1|nr:transforming acidic coiled-coil-containing protein 1 isoform X2 [Callorhinchus milii]
MAFSAWQILSPIQWAKWTWSAVRGGEAEAEAEAEVEAEAEGHRQDRGSQPGDRRLSFSSDSEGNFDTPDENPPVRAPSENTRTAARSERGGEQPSGDGSGVRAEDKQSPETTQPLRSLTLNDPLLESHQIGVAHSLKPPAQIGTGTNRSVASDINVEVIQGSSSVPNSSIAQGAGKIGQEFLLRSLEVDATSKSQETSVEGRVSGENTPAMEPTQSTPSNAKQKKARPRSLTSLGEAAEGVGMEEDLTPGIKGYNFNPDDFDDSKDPFGLGGSKLQNSPPANRHGPVSAGTGRAEAGEGSERADPRGLALKLEFDFSDDKENAENRKPQPKKAGRKNSGKSAGKKLKPGASKAGVSERKDDTSVSANSLEDPPSTNSCDANQWDNPNFNPFGGTPKLQNSPTLPKASYNFEPDSFDDSIDPFKPSKVLVNETQPTAALEGQSNGTDTNSSVLAADDEKAMKSSPKKARPRVITNACRVKKYENQSLVLDVCSQDDEALQISQTPDTAQREQHATDEEKLASTTSATNQKHAPPAVKGESEEDLEFFECSALTTAADKTEFSSASEFSDAVKSKELDHQEHGTSVPQIPFSAMELGSSESTLSFQAVLGEMDCCGRDELCRIEADKTAVLSLIREEIVEKEMEANEWKRKYEGSRQEVIEMRKIVAEYEKTIAQMIEDEQHNKMASQTSMQQLIMEKDQALADLNSVERSLSDLFRRYENMKGVLEGFKKNEEVLKKCAQDYLARVKQEEARYQALKLHAEEKLDKANEEIAQVRGKASAEGAAMQASLRKEQMKVDSLDRTIQQKNQEIEELTKICDELIAKLGKVN